MKIENESRLKADEITNKINIEWKIAYREHKKRKIDAHTTINEAKKKDEERKLEEIRRKKSNREWWLYLKEDDNKEEDKEIDLRINGIISKEQEKIIKHKKFLGKFG